MGGTAVTTALATIVSAVIAGLVAISVQRQVRKSNESTARSTVEEQAFTRAEGIYTNALKTAREEIHDLETEVGKLKSRVSDLESELETAKRALRLRYPDE